MGRRCIIPIKKGNQHLLSSQLKSICRLNRILLFGFMALTISHVWGQFHWWSTAVFLSLMFVHSVALIASEFLLKMLGRLREVPEQALSHLSVVLPVAYTAYSIVVYLVTGSFTAFTMGLFGILQAQFLGHKNLGKLLSLTMLISFLSGVAVNYPHPLPVSPIHLLLTLLPAGVALYYYGKMVYRLVSSHYGQVEKLQSIAATDVLTGLVNRRQFNLRLNGEIARARRHQTPLSLALFDLDDFKKLNDFYGHPVGDKILRELGKLISQNIRECDVAARYGGEEFALILPETGEKEAYDLLERIRELIAQTVFCLPENPLTISMSVGVAELENTQNTTFELVERADVALYEAKRQGKNRVVSSSSLLPPMLKDTSYLT